MKIECGINSNCSEPVSQICGVQKMHVPLLKQAMKDTFSNKFTTEYIDSYLDKLLVFDGKYCLNLYDFENELEMFKELSEVAEKIKCPTLTVSSCSDPICDDESMDRQMEWYKSTYRQRAAKLKKRLRAKIKNIKKMT